MAHPPYNQYSQTRAQNMPPLQTQNHTYSHGAYSPPSYQQSPNALSPTAGSMHPAKRARLSPQPGQPASPYSPFSTSPFGQSPGAMSPPTNQYLSLPQSPVTAQPSPSFNQPQPYQYANAVDPRVQQQNSMPPPKVPYSKAQDPQSRLQDNSELEKSNARDMDVNNISDVLTGSGIDLRAEEEAMLHNVSSRGYGDGLASQTAGSTATPHGSFDRWDQQSNHGAFRGTGPLSQPVTEEQLEQELTHKHQRAARILNESAAVPLTDPFLLAQSLRTRVGKRAYENGITVNLEGLFDKIPEKRPQNVTRTNLPGPTGEAVVGLQASSILNQNAPLVEILSLLSLAAEERVRTVIEDAFALSQGRQNTSDGMVPPSFADIAVANGKSTPRKAVQSNTTKTAWEAATDTAISASPAKAPEHVPNAARLPTPPSEAPPTPQPTVQFTTNHVADGLKRRMAEDERFERERIAKRQKRLQGSTGTPIDTPTIASLPPPEKMTKKERDRISKLGNTDEAMHRKANETASMAFGKKKKYAWMTGGGPSKGSAPNVATPAAVSTPTGVPSGASPAAAAGPEDKALLAQKRKFAGGDLERSDLGRKIQVRDLVHVLDNDGRGRKTLVHVMARLRSFDKDEKRIGEEKVATPR